MTRHPILDTADQADELVLRALQAGAAGFLLKDTAPTGIVAAIEAVHAGDGSLSPAASSASSPGTPTPPPGKSTRAAGSPRSPPASTRSPPPSPKGTPTPTSPPAGR